MYTIERVQAHLFKVDKTQENGQVQVKIADSKSTHFLLLQNALATWQFNRIVNVTVSTTCHVSKDGEVNVHCTAN